MRWPVVQGAVPIGWTHNVAESHTVQQHACPESACESHLWNGLVSEVETELRLGAGSRRVVAARCEAPVCS